MTTLALHSETRTLVKPVPRSPISIRVAVPGPADIHFMDELQMKHSKMVGWFATDWFVDNIKKGNVLIAEEPATQDCPAPPTRIGYVLFKDQYLKREELAIFYQVNVAPSRHRGLVGAALVKAALDRAAYGVKLACCWCAQDLDANHFWESLGFVPLAFRAGSRGKAHGGSKKDTRMQIFWQRRIREGDNETPYWFPSHTDHGAMREGRIVLPIPPGTHWSDAKPAVLPGMEKLNALPEGEEAKTKPKAKREKKPKPDPYAPVSITATNGLRFGPLPEPKAEKPAKPKREKQKNDPKLVAAAREFRDRYLDEINTGRMLPSASGKYDVSRQLETASSMLHAAPLLEQKRAA